MERLEVELDTSNSTFVISFRDANDNPGGGGIGSNSIWCPSSYGDNFLGFSDAAYTDGQNAKVQLVGSIDDAQVGLTTGRKHYGGGAGSGNDSG